MKTCNACQAISGGYGHVYYGLFILFALLVIMAFLTHDKYILAMAIVGMLIITGVSVDLVTHGYAH